MKLIISEKRKRNTGSESKLARRLMTGVLLALAVFLATGVSLAWYGELRESKLKVSGSVTYVARYFESGNGTTDAKYDYSSGGDRWGDYAYEIKTPEQLYNLAWLQYLGYFNKEESSEEDVVYHFYLSEDLDMTGYILPPIGTGKCPFMGVFDGNGKKISNLTVSNSLSYTYTDEDGKTYGPMMYGEGSDDGDNKSEMPLQAYEELGETDGKKDDLTNVEIIGLFGVVGNYAGGAIYNSKTAEIRNLTIEGISVVGRSSTKKCLAGLAAGYVNGTMEDVTVTGSIDGGDATDGVNVNTGETTVTAEQITDKLSYYTTVGYCVTLNTVNVAHSVSVKTVSFSAADESSNFGGTIDMKSLYQRLKNVVNGSSASAAPRYESSTTSYERATSNVAYSLVTGTTENPNPKYGDEHTKDTSTYSFLNVSDDWASYSFSRPSMSGNYVYLHGADNVAASYQYPSDMMSKTSTYTTDAYPTFKIKQNGAYLNADLSNNVVTGGTDEDAATLWSFVTHDHVSNGSSFLVTQSNGTNYYLTVSGSSLVLKTSYTEASAWTREEKVEQVDGVDVYSYIYSSGANFLFYDSTATAWKVAQLKTQINIQVSQNVPNGNPSAFHYLCSDSLTKYSGLKYNGTRGGIKDDTKYLWHMTGEGKLYVVPDGTNNKYLNLSGTTLSFGTDESTATAWKTESAGDVGGLATYYFYTGSTPYYLKFEWSQVNTYTLYREWKVDTSKNEKVGTDAAANKEGYTTRLHMIVVSSGDASTYKCTQTDTDTKISYAYDVVDNNIRAPYITNDTVVPITIKDSVGTSYPSGGYETLKKNSGAKYANTGYFVSGAEQGGEASSAMGNIRVSEYSLSSALKIALNGASSYDDSKLEILTRIADGDTGQRRIRDTENTETGYKGNAGNNDVSGTINTYNDGTAGSLGLNQTVYAKARKELYTVMNADKSNVYGLHFMNAQISRSNVVEFPKAWINGKLYDNYQMPRNSIDFVLNTKGYISFFAGTYYVVGTGQINDSFFSLHQIYRDSDNKITDIKEISEIYQDTDGTYVYKYSDGTYSDYSSGIYFDPTSEAPGCVTADNLKFKTSWLTQPENFVTYAVYYFQIPTNKGEYALGSTSGTGAYLFYLDICSNPDEGKQDIIRTESLEKVTTSVSNCPDGVGFGTVRDAAIELPFGTQTTAAVTTSGSGSTAKTTAVKISPAVDGAACVYAASYASGSETASVKVYNGSDEITASAESSRKYIYTITENNTTTGDTITQVGRVKDDPSSATSIKDDGTFTIAGADVEEILVEKTGEFTTVPSDKEYDYKLNNETIVIYEYQILAGKEGTVTINPRFTYDIKYSGKAGSHKGTDVIEVTSSEEDITLRNFDVTADYTVQIKGRDGDIGSDSEISITASGSGS